MYVSEYLVLKYKLNKLQVLRRNIFVKILGSIIVIFLEIKKKRRVHLDIQIYQELLKQVDWYFWDIFKEWIDKPKISLNIFRKPNLWK